MRIGYYIRDYVVKDNNGSPAISGGVKVVSQHVKILRELGFDTLLLTRNVKVKNLRELNLVEDPFVVNNTKDLPKCDFYVATRYSDVEELYFKYDKRIAHLCQGYEPIDYESRIKGEVVTDKYSRKGFFSFIKYIDRLKFRKRIRKIESVYKLPTIKVAVSKQLVDLIENRFGQRCFLIQNGIDNQIFFPNEKRKWGNGGKIKILSVGSSHVGSKGIPDTLQAIKLLKEKSINIEFIRVSPHLPSQMEKTKGLVDQYYINLKEQEMAELYRNVDIFISSSLEGEGFGLPAMEALASGVPSILTEISSYKSFDERMDFAYFVPIHRPDLIADGILMFTKNQNLRERYRQKGLKVANKYTLEKTKEDIINFIKGIQVCLT